MCGRCRIKRFEFGAAAAELSYQTCVRRRRHLAYTAAGLCLMRAGGRSEFEGNKILRNASLICIIELLVCFSVAFARSPAGSQIKQLDGGGGEK